MSYTSESVFPPSAKLVQVREVISLLGYRAVADGLKVPRCVDSCFWFDERDYRSHTGVELYVYRTSAGRIEVTTRSRAGRSYWDVIHQNRTLKLLRNLVGGHFTTDAGRNRYWRPEGKPSAPAASGCYLARWRYHNALIRSRIYLNYRGLEAPIARPEATGLLPFDSMNPRLLSNNLLLPYLVAIWEEYFKLVFIALLQYSRRREAVLKGARLAHDHLEAIAAGVETVERALADSLTFQRPSAIAAHFNLLDPKLDLGGTLKSPYRRRSVSLYESLEALVERRHAFVHTGEMSTAFSDSRLQAALKDFEVAVDRTYQRIADHYGWPAERDF